MQAGIFEHAAKYSITVVSFSLSVRYKLCKVEVACKIRNCFRKSQELDVKPEIEENHKRISNDTVHFVTNLTNSVEQQ